MKRIAFRGFLGTALVILTSVLALFIWRRPSVAVIKDGLYTNAIGEIRAWILITNPLPYRIKYVRLPVEVKSYAGWSESEGLKIIPATGKPYETGLIFGGETLEPRSGFRFIDGHNATDQSPYRYPVLWGIPPEAAAARPKWKRRLDELAIRLRGRPLVLPYGIVRSPAITPQLPNHDGPANGSQPSGSE